MLRVRMLRTLFQMLPPLPAKRRRWHLTFAVSFIQ